MIISLITIFRMSLMILILNMRLFLPRACYLTIFEFSVISCFQILYYYFNSIE